MRKPEPGDRIRCPEARSTCTYLPEKVFDLPSWLDSTKTIRYGILGKHSHGIQATECVRSGVPFRLEEQKK